MRNYVLSRLIQLVPILIGITFLTFALMQLTNDDAERRGDEDRQRDRHEHEFDGGGQFIDERLEHEFAADE